MTTPASTPIDPAHLASEVEALKADLAALPATEFIEKAVYHCDRLARALRSSHHEATRFAAFTVLKIVRDHAAELSSSIPARAQAIRRALEASGFDLSK